MNFVPNVPNTSLTFLWLEGLLSIMVQMKIDESRNGSVFDLPEFNIAVFSFLLHFVWEFVQVPTYSGMADMNHWDGTKLCLSATVGDVGFALTAFWVTSLAARRRDWISQAKSWQVVLFVAVGVALTVGFEFYYTEISKRWTYSELMPLVPPLGTGLSPLVQWLLIPPVVLWFTRRQMSGSGSQRSSE